MMSAQKKPHIDAANDGHGVEERPLSLTKYDYSVNNMRPVEFVIDGFLSTGITLFAGQAGIGKSTGIITLACIAAGLVKHDNIKATLRRKVFYVTEDVGQVERILYGMRSKGLITADEDEIKKWFEVYPAQRISAADVGSNVKAIRRDGCVVQSKELNHYKTEPLIVLDTSNANIDLDDENSNSQAGVAIAYIKQSLGAAALWLVGHTAKSIGRSDVKSMSFRGAGAFEGDCHAVAYIFQEGKGAAQVRFIALGKHRYVADFREVRVDGETGSTSAMTPWGKLQVIPFIIGMLSRSSELDRMEAAGQAKAELAEQKAKDDDEWLRSKIFEVLRDAGPLSGNDVYARTGKQKGIVLSTLDKLVSTGHLVLRLNVPYVNSRGSKCTKDCYALPNQKPNKEEN